MKWIDTFQKDIKDLGFKVQERWDGSVSVLIAKNKNFIIRVCERTDNAFRYAVDVSVARNFDRWANSTDWFVESREPFSAKDLIDVVERFYKQKYYNNKHSDYLEITRNVLCRVWVSSLVPD